MSNVEILSSVKHANLRVKQGFSSDFGDNIMAAVTFPEEFVVLSGHFPLIFRENVDSDGDDFLCVALMGLEQNENLFLNLQGYPNPQFPLTMKIRPFMVGEDPNDPQRGSVFIDTSSSRLTIDPDEGEALFDENGQHTEFLKGRISQLELCYSGRKKGIGFIQMLRDYDLLEPFNADLKFKDNTQKTITGFYGVNVERLNELPAQSLKKLSDKGYLMPCYLAVASLARLGDLIERKNALIDK